MSEQQAYATPSITEIGETRWEGGHWGRVLEECTPHIVRSMEEALLDPGNAAYLRNFDAASGREPEQHHWTHWSDGDCYMWIEAVAYVYSVYRDRVHDELMDTYIEKIAAAQEPDGCLCTEIQLYGAGRFKGTISQVGEIHLRQMTTYPWAGSAYLEVLSSTGSCVLKVRAPAWCNCASLGVNARVVDKHADAGSLYYEPRGDDPVVEIATRTDAELDCVQFALHDHLCMKRATTAL